MYCPNRGAPGLDDRAVFCPKCGVQIQPFKSSIADTGSIGWCILGFLIPIVGLILYLVWKDEKPVSAKQAGLGALASVCLGVVAYIVLFVMLFSM